MCQKCGKIDKCGCCSESPCSKCLDCFPVDYKVVRQEKKVDNCGNLADQIRQIISDKLINNKGCNITAKAVTEGTTITVLASTLTENAVLEYSNNGVIFGSDNTFEEQPCGRRPYYVRIVGKPQCVINVMGEVTEGCDTCEPDWRPTNLPTVCKEDNFEWITEYDGCSEFRETQTTTPCTYCKDVFTDVVPTQPRCQGGLVEILQLNNCGEPKWRRTTAPCGTCSPHWVIVSAVDPKCISGFVNVFESDGCGSTRWRATSETCSDCVPNWVTATPLYQECNSSNQVLIRQSNQCNSQTRMYNTLITCGDVVTPCSPTISLAGVPSQICVSDIVSIDSSAMSASGGNGQYRWALVKTSEFNGVENLNWGTVRVWQVTDYGASYRIYVSALGADLSSPSCYAYVSLTTIQCGGGGGNPCPQNFIIVSGSANENGATFTTSGYTGVNPALWRLKNSSSVIVQSGSTVLSGGVGTVTFSAIVAPGNYTLEIEASNCTSSVTSIPVQITSSGGVVETDDPSLIGLTTLAYSIDVVTHDGGYAANGTSNDFIIQVKSENAPQPLTGITWNGSAEVPMNESTWIPNDTRWPSGTYGMLFRINAVTDGVDAQQPGYRYKVYIKNPAVPGYVFVKSVLLPSSSTSSWTEIPISGGGSGECPQGPDLVSIVSANPSTVVYQYIQSGVTQHRYRVKSGSSIVYQSVVSPSGNTVTINLPTPLIDGSYTVEIEGVSCTSDVSSLPFNINTGGTEPVMQTSEDGVFIVTRAGLEYRMNHGINTIIHVLNNGNIRITQQNGSPVPRTKTANVGTANLIITKNEKTLRSDEIDALLGAEGLFIMKDKFTVITMMWQNPGDRNAVDRRQHTPWESWTKPESSDYFAGESEYVQLSIHDL